MGLDVVELIMDIEEGFNIEISDEEACQAVTVEKMYQCVLDKVTLSSGYRCSSQKAFYSLRKALMENLSIEKKVITPKTNIELLFPESERRKRWSKMSENVPYKFPELKYPVVIGFLFITIALLSGSFFTYLLSLCFERYNISYKSAISGLTCILLTIAVCKMMFKKLLVFKLIVPQGCNTLGGIAKHISYHNTDCFGTLNKKEIWDRLTLIISEQLGVGQEDIKPESNFVEDLNI